MRGQKDVPKLIREVTAQGFRVEMPRGRSGRCRVISPAGAVVVMPGPRQRTSARALLNACAALRRAGADV